MKSGVSLSGLTVLGGIWIGIAPFWLGYAPKHGPVWTPVVAVSVWLGLIIVAAGLIGLIGFWAGGLAELDRQWRRRSSRPAGVASPAAAPPQAPPARALPASDPPGAENDPDAQLQALMDRVLKDHSLAFEKQS
jgi:hypothetical protein